MTGAQDPAGSGNKPKFDSMGAYNRDSTQAAPDDGSKREPEQAKPTVEDKRAAPDMRPMDASPKDGEAPRESKAPEKREEPTKTDHVPARSVESDAPSFSSSMMSRMIQQARIGQRPEEKDDNQDGGLTYAAKPDPTSQIKMVSGGDSYNGSEPSDGSKDSGESKLRQPGVDMSPVVGEMMKMNKTLSDMMMMIAASMQRVEGRMDEIYKALTTDATSSSGGDGMGVG